jgi:hypothetical protein
MDDADDSFPSLPYVFGSETSQAAALSAAKNAKNVARSIFDKIAAAGADGMTTDELNALFYPLGYENQSVGPRVKDLAERRMITRGPDKRLTQHGKGAFISRAVADVTDFDAWWNRPIKRTPTERATAAFKKLTRDIAKQAMTGGAHLPACDETRRLLDEALLRLYATFDR